MTTGKLLATAGILLALVSLSFLPAAAQSYTVTDLGVLGGNGTSGAFAINDSGAVVGWSSTASGSQHAFSWSASTGMMDLGVLNSSDGFSLGYGINRSGQVVGASGSYAFLWTKGRIEDIGTLGGTGATAYGINNLAQVVGGSEIPNNTGQHAFLWSATNGMKDLGSLGGTTSVAYAINDAGQVAGYSTLSDNVTLHAFLWTSEQGMQDLGTVGGTASGAQAINSSGQVVGWSIDADNLKVGFLWDSQHGMRSLGAARNQGMVALGINQRRQVVGYVGAGTRGFLWTESAGVQNINAFISPKDPFVTAAYAINSAGQIVGNGSNVHALLLTPTK